MTLSEIKRVFKKHTGYENVTVQMPTSSVLTIQGSTGIHFSRYTFKWDGCNVIEVYGRVKHTGIAYSKLVSLFTKD